jgi:hypothetical protein
MKKKKLQKYQFYILCKELKRASKKKRSKWRVFLREAKLKVGLREMTAMFNKIFKLS